jgi:hypothetical protein
MFNVIMDYVDKKLVNHNIGFMNTSGLYYSVYNADKTQVNQDFTPRYLLSLAAFLYSSSHELVF